MERRARYARKEQTWGGQQLGSRRQQACREATALSLAATELSISIEARERSVDGRRSPATSNGLAELGRSELTDPRATECGRE